MKENCTRLKLRNIYRDIELFLGDNVRKNLIILTALGLLTFASEASFIFVLQGFFRSVRLVNNEQLFLPNWYPQGVLGSLFFLVLFGFFRMVSGILKTYFATKIQFTFTYVQRKNLFVMGLKHAHLLSFKEIVSLFGETVSHSAVAVFNASTLVGLVITSAFYIILGSRLAPYEMLIGFILLGSVYFPIKLFTTKTNYQSRGIRHEWNELNDVLLRGLKNNFFINVYNQVENEINKGKIGLKKYNGHFINYSLISSFTSSLPLFFGIIIISILSFISIGYIHTEPMKLISFFYIFIRLSQSASELSSTVSILRVNFPRLRRLFEVSKQINKLESNLVGKEKFPDCEEVTLKVVDLGFGYDKSDLLFHDLNFIVKKGNVLLIKGESGSGKSTILSILFGLNRPNFGQVFLNDYLISENDYDFQRHLAYVGPEPFLIQGTVKENLLYGYEANEVISDQQIWSALKVVELDQVIKLLSLGFEEPVADIPALSTGQKQRLSLARALLREPKLLVLDEATSNLDLETEKKIIDNLSSVFKKCAVVVVSHKNTFDDIASEKLILNATARS